MDGGTGEQESQPGESALSNEEAAQPLTEADAEAAALVNVLRVLGSGQATQAPPLTRDEIERQGLAQANELKRQAFDQEMKLRERYANDLLGHMGKQLLIANGVFVAYAWFGVGWKIPPAVMNVWFSATVIQIVSVVTVVTTSLFPRKPSAPE